MVASVEKRKGSGRADLNEAAAKMLAAVRGRQAYGRAAAVTQATVAKIAGMSSRKLQDATLVLIQQGVPIVTTCEQPCGMFMARTLTELGDYRDQLHARIVGLAVRQKGINRIYRDWIERESVEPSGQRRMFCE